MKRPLFFIFLVLNFKLIATHIVGGEMIYDYLGNDNYRITLKIYRDCASGTAAFDGVGNGPSALPAVLTVIESLNSFNSYTVDIGAPVVTAIPPTINNPCIKTPTNICVEEGIYTYTLTLPPKGGGYYIVYQRCCRNNSVLNLLNSGNQGSTYYTKIPGPEEAIANNSPRFKNFPPIFLCNELDFTFDHSATDPDGDQLVYSLCPPFHGIDGCCTFIGNVGTPVATQNCPTPPPTCPLVAPPPPYPLVSYVFPYDGSYPIASNPSVTIDPVTGLLKGTPNLIGQFVVGVCVQEFRNGTLISTHFRDFQFNISPCIVSVVSSIADQKNLCIGNTITFTNQSTSNVGALTYHWDFGVTTLTSDTSNLINTSYTYQDTGVYVLTLIATPPGKVCADTLTKLVYVYPPLIMQYDRPEKQCFKNNSFDFKAKGIYIPSQIGFEWNFTASASPSTSALQNPAEIVFSQPGLYFVKLLGKQFACRDSFIDSVRVVKRPQAKINNLPASACNPAKLFLKNGSTSDLPLNYSWDFGNGEVSGDFEPSVTFTSPGVYKIKLVVATTSLCIDTSAVLINNFTVTPSPVADFNLLPEITSIFDPEITVVNAASYDVIYWRYRFGDGDSTFAASPVHIYRAFGDYLISQKVTNAFGCVDSAERLLRVLPEFRFWIPNTFTPDGNGMNDVFKPSIYGAENYSFQIFDRWGKKIFETGDQQYGWDGRLKDTDCKQDVYIWRILFKNLVSQKQEERCGHVLLLRNM